jgi:hypothetical protein
MKCLPFGFVRRGKLWAKDIVRCYWELGENHGEFIGSLRNIIENILK